MNKPKVSIIVALYNKEKYIKKCLKSLVNQTLKDIEIIVVNDCSTDKSLDVVKSLDDKRIKVINNKKNKGIGITRNIGVAKATGEYIGFVDADDYVEKDMYEKYYNYAKEYNLDLLTSDYFKIINNKKEYFKVDNFKITNIEKNNNIINLINYGPCNKLFKRDLIINNNIIFSETTKFEDVIFVAKAIRYSKNIRYLNEAYYNYVIHSLSETTTVDKRTFDIFEVLDNVNDIYSNLYGTKELEYFNINEVTRYMLKQRYVSNKKERENFIDSGYSYLYSINSDWRKNRIYKKEPLYKRIIKNNKTFLSIYCKMSNRGD